MKRSKIFLSITTGVLAVVAFSTTKLPKFTAKFKGYYSYGNPNGAKCTLSCRPTLFYTAGSVEATCDIIKLYKFSHGQCTIQLFTRPVNGD